MQMVATPATFVAHCGQTRNLRRIARKITIPPTSRFISQILFYFLSVHRYLHPARFPTTTLLLTPPPHTHSTDPPPPPHPPEKNPESQKALETRLTLLSLPPPDFTRTHRVKYLKQFLFIIDVSREQSYLDYWREFYDCCGISNKKIQTASKSNVVTANCHMLSEISSQS